MIHLQCVELLADGNPHVSRCYFISWQAETVNEN